MIKSKLKHAIGILAIAAATATAPTISSAEVRISSGHFVTKTGGHGKSHFHNRSRFHGKHHHRFDRRRASGNRHASSKFSRHAPRHERHRSAKRSRHHNAIIALKLLGARNH